MLYSDGDSEELNLKKERWDIISEVRFFLHCAPIYSLAKLSKKNLIGMCDLSPKIFKQEKEEIDLPDSTPLSDM